MTGKDAIKYLLEQNQQILHMYLADLSDEDLLVRPAPGANHIAWQLGHLISAEAQFFMPKIPGAKAPELPAGFSKQHSAETSSVEPPQGFLRKSDYLALFDQVRAASLAAIDKLGEAELDKPSGWEMANTVGKACMTIGNHDMMHAAQFTVVRRKLGKKVLF